jgi:hypothetical protein
MSARQACLLVLALGAVTPWAGAEPAATPDQALKQAVEALERGSFEEAIDLLEGLSDQGFLHPDVSYDRAVAYADRARTPQARPGDLGRAAAALGEVLVLRPDDREAELALERVRAEIGRRRVRQGQSPLVARPSLPRAVVGLADEFVWLSLGALGSLFLTLGLGLRGWREKAPFRLAGGIAATVGLLLVVVGGGLGAWAGYFRRNSEPAVVVVPEARLLDRGGQLLSSSPGASSVTIPEGAAVYLLERQGALSRVEWGTRQGWVPSHAIRVLGRL